MGLRMAEALGSFRAGVTKHNIALIYWVGDFHSQPCSLSIDSSVHHSNLGLTICHAGAY